MIFFMHRASFKTYPVTKMCLLAQDKQQSECVATEMLAALASGTAAAQPPLSLPHAPSSPQL